MAMCIYNNCNSVQKPFSSVTFFTLPKDHRRRLWIENSGNPELATLSESARRVVCQKHFSPSSLRKQFHRTILSRDAVPEKWSNSSNEFCVELIEIEDNEDNDHTTNDTQDKLITVKDDYDDETAQEDANDWQNNYENSSADETDCILEFEVDDCDENSQTIDNCVIDDRITNDEIEQNPPITEEELNILEELPPNRLAPLFHNVEIEKSDSKKRKKMDVVDITSDEPLHELDNNVQCRGTASDVLVSSSTSKSDESASGLPQITNEEDKYFALALVGILHRISPQKKAFAKVNILRYLTELEYGVEATIN